MGGAGASTQYFHDLILIFKHGNNIEEHAWLVVLFTFLYFCQMRDICLTWKHPFRRSCHAFILKSPVSVSSAEYPSCISSFFAMSLSVSYHQCY